MLKKIIYLFLSWRILLFIPLFLGHVFVPFRHGYPYASPLYFLSDKHSLISNFLLSPWANFDGVYYLLIAAKGYTVNAGFFPLFPLSLNFATSIFGQILPFDPKQYFTALLLVGLYILIALIVMYKLVRIDYKESIVLSSIVFMLLFPTSFFFATIYSESLFLLLSICAFYFARKKRWILASLCGALLTATRFVGIAILPALTYEFIKEERTLFKAKSLNLLLVPLGILSYMWLNLQKWGNTFYFIQAQGHFENNRSITTPIFIPQTIYRYIKILTRVSPSHFEWWIAILEISTFIFVVVMLFVAWKKRLRPSYILFAFICFLIPISSGTFSGLPRYSLVLFPIFIALALIKNKVTKILYTVISFILLFILFTLFSKGYFIA